MSESVQDIDPGAIGGEPHKAFVAEHRGIAYVPEDQRDGKPGSLFWMWAGSILNVLPITFGALLPLIGLSFTQSIVIAIVGNLSWLLVGIASQSGPDAGTTALMISRAPFGQNGNRFVGIFQWLALLGFEASFMVVTVQAGLALAEKAGVDPGDGLKAVIIVIAGLLLPIIALYGHATIVRVLGGLSVISVVFFAIVAIIVIPKAHPSVFGHSAPWGTLAIGLSIIVSGSGFGFVLQAADYSRYLSKNHTNRKVLFWATSGGGFVAETLLTLLGVVIATELTKGVDAVSGVPTLFTSWFAVPYLILIALQILAANAFALYSSGLTLQSIGLRVKRWMAVAIDTSICVVVTFIAIFSNSFYNLLSDFLLFVLIFFAPFVAIYLVDWGLRRGTYDSDGLQTTKGGIYWRRGGVHLAGIISLVLGMVAASLWLNTSVYVGPLASRIGDSDLSWLVGALVGGLTYLIFAARRVRSETLATVEQQNATEARSDASNGSSDSAPVVGTASGGALS